MVWHSHHFRIIQFIAIYTAKGFGVISTTEGGFFVFCFLFLMELSCFFYDPTDVGNLISGPSLFSEYNLNTWKFSVHVLLKPGLENFENYFASCEMSAIV